MNFDHLMQKVRDAANGGINSMSTGEALSAALVLNRPDWLQAMDYTIAEALGRIDESTIPLIRKAEQVWKKEQDALRHVDEIARNAAASATILEPSDSETVVDLASELVTYSEAAGYRDVSLYFDVTPIGRGKGSKQTHICLRIRPEDAHQIVSYLVEVHRFAWRDERGPLDKRDGETRPIWIDAKV